MAWWSKRDEPVETPEQVEARLSREGERRGEAYWCALGNCAMCTDLDCTCVCHD